MTSLPTLANDLINGTVTLSEWTISMREYIRIIHTEAAALACGGWENVTPSMWGYVGSLIKKQYQFLDQFALDIQTNSTYWLNGRLLVRMEMYSRAEWGTFESVLQRLAIMSGKTEERRVLGVADHCDDCLSAAGQSWQPIGTLPLIGNSQCKTNCHCTFEYR